MSSDSEHPFFQSLDSEGKTKAIMVSQTQREYNGPKKTKKACKIIQSARRKKYGPKLCRK